MSDEPEQTPGDESPANETPANESPSDKTSAPAPRPRSTTSRARRIGGAAVARTGSETDGGTGDGSEPSADATGTAEKPGKATRSAKPTALTKAGKPAAPTAASATKDEAEPDPSAGRGSVTVSLPGWLRWAPGFAFAAVAVVFLTLFIVARLGNDAASSTSSEERQKVLAAAKNCLATLNTYSYTKLDAAEAAGVKCTTGKLTSDYRKTVTTVIRQNAPRLKATQLAKITTAGIESVTKNGKQWTVLAYGQLNITTANQKNGRIDPFAVVARMQQVDGKWVLSKVDTVSSFTS